MKNFVIIVCLVIMGLRCYSQHFNDYLVKGKPIPIQEKPNGSILIQVPVNKLITDITFDKELNCFFGRYEKAYGSISTIWLPEYFKSLKDSIDKQYQDSVRIAQYVKESMENGSLFLPKSGDTLVFYQNATIYR